MSDKLLSTTVYFEPEAMRKLDVLSKRTNVPKAAYVRQGLDLVLNKHFKERGDDKAR